MFLCDSVPVDFMRRKGLVNIPCYVDGKLNQDKKQVFIVTQYFVLHLHSFADKIQCHLLQIFGFGKIVEIIEFKSKRI